MSNINKNSDPLDNDNFTTPMATDLVTSTTALKAPGGDSSKYQRIYSSTNDYAVYNGNGYYWEISYSSATGEYTYTARVGSATGGIAQTVVTVDPINIIGARTIIVDSGVFLDGVYMSATALIGVQSGATVTNSTLYGIPTRSSLTNAGTVTNSIIDVATTRVSGGTASGNVYVSGVMTVQYHFTSSTNNTSITTETPIINGSPIINVTAGGSFDINSNYWANGAKVTIEANSYNCFLSGTMIQTASGLVAIENIQINDKVITYEGDQQKISSVIWVGYNTAKAIPFLPKDEAGYPIRIVKDAIAQDVPSKDLLITSEHCIFLNNQFVPARMLVNGSTIFYDDNISEYTFYHLETEEHSVISADNVLTESYLDTGNRHNFLSDNNIVTITNKKKEWNVDSAAPLVTIRDIVEPIFMQLNERAAHLGFETISNDILTTDNSGLHLLTNSGEVIEATYQAKDRFIFKLPKHATQIRLISRTNCPSQVVGPFVDDRRQLGVLIGEVTLLEGNKSSSITEHFTSKDLQGWHTAEQTQCRWTNGSALLSIRNKPSENIGILIIQILAGGPYLLENLELQQVAI